NLTGIDIDPDIHIRGPGAYIPGLAREAPSKLFLHGEIPRLDVAALIGMLIDGRSAVSARQRYESVAVVRKLRRWNALLQGGGPGIRIGRVVSRNQQSRV